MNVYFLASAIKHVNRRLLGASFWLLYTNVNMEMAEWSREELAVVNPQYSVSGVTVSITIDSLQADRSGLNSGTDDLFFDINAKIDEQKKDAGQVTLGFQLFISTKPNVVKYSIAGTVLLSGKSDDVKKKLEVNPKTKIPQILFTIYQHVFSSIYMLSSNLNTPYPPPDLLHPMAEKIQIISTNQIASEITQSTSAAATVQASPASATPVANTAQPAVTK